eukprot:gene11470-11564_t
MQKLAEDTPRIIGNECVKVVKDNFRIQGYDSGLGVKTWDKRKPATDKAYDRGKTYNSKGVQSKYRSGKNKVYKGSVFSSSKPILDQTGTLKNSPKYKVNSKQVKIGVDLLLVPYAEKMNEGGNGTPARQFMPKEEAPPNPKMLKRIKKKIVFERDKAMKDFKTDQQHLVAILSENHQKVSQAKQDISRLESELNDLHTKLIDPKKGVIFPYTAYEKLKSYNGAKSVKEGIRKKVETETTVHKFSCRRCGCALDMGVNKNMPAPPGSDPDKWRNHIDTAIKNYLSSTDSFTDDFNSFQRDKIKKLWVDGRVREAQQEAQKILDHPVLKPECQAIPDFQVGTVMRKTDYSSNKIGSYTMPLLLVDFIESNESGQVLGGNTREEWNIGFNAYNNNGDPYGDDQTGRHFTKGNNGVYIQPEGILYAGLTFMVLDAPITYDGQPLPVGTRFTATEGNPNYTTAAGGYVVSGGWLTPEMWEILNKYAFRFTLGGVHPADALDENGLVIGYRILMESVCYDMDTNNIIQSTSAVTSVNQVNNPPY